jgi:ribose-phosphate pyrophosphokinase
VVLVDDMVDTAGTLTKAADMMMEQGRHQRACHLHPCRAQRPRLRAHPEQRPPELIVSDTIPVGPDKLAAAPKIKQLSVARLFADVIQRVRHHESISSHFIIA